MTGGRFWPVIWNLESIHCVAVIFSAETEIIVPRFGNWNQIFSKCVTFQNI